MPFPAQDLACPDPAGCVVPAAVPQLATTQLSAGTVLYRVYDTTWGYDEFNPGFGDTRFAPFDDESGLRVPARYLADTEQAALLETVFHDVHHSTDRLIYETTLRDRALAHVAVPRQARLLDLRDDALHAAGLTRAELVSTHAEHYPCTRRIAADLHTRWAGSPGTAPVDGLVWHSRQAELLRRGPAEVYVLFGDRYGTARGNWRRIGAGVRNLFEGPGRLLIDEIAEELAATVVPAE